MNWSVTTSMYTAIASDRRPVAASIFQSNRALPLARYVYFPALTALGVFSDCILAGPHGQP